MTEERVQHARAWLATIVLAAAGLIMQADKTLPSLLIEPIKHAMGLSDTQLGLLTGFSFTISISIATLPLAWLADRYDRTLLLGGAITIWCLLTVASGFAHSFTSLFLCRLGVGIGEAALTPASISLLADLLPMRRLPRASAAMSYAGAMGSFAAMAGGGALYGGLHAAAIAHRLPLAPEDAWRWTTIAFGAIGLVVAVLTTTVLPEPRRKAPRAITAGGGGTGLRAYLRIAAPLLLPLGLTLSIYGILLTGFMSWGAPFFARTYGWSVAQVGRVMGTVTLIGGLLGPLVGLLINRLVSRRLGREAPLAAICAMLVISLPFVAGGPLLANGLWSAAAYGVVIALTHGCGVITSAVYASIAPSHLRARVLASLTLVFGVVASSGSVVYAAFTDHVVGDPARLYVTMSLLSGLLTVVSIVAAFIADRRFIGVVASARQAEAPLGA